MPRGRHRHSPPLHRLLPPSAIAGVSLVCALAPWVFAEPVVVRGLAAAAAVTAVVGAVVMRRWDAQAGKQVADLTRARASDEWRHEERVAELETDLDESRELRVKLEQRLRAKRAELAGLRNEHAALLRRYATAETERASALEGRRLLEIEAATPSRALLPAPVAEAPEEAEAVAAPAEAETAEEKPVALAVFSPEGSRLFLRAKEALSRFGDEALLNGEGATKDADSAKDESSAKDLNSAKGVNSAKDVNFAKDVNSAKNSAEPGESAESTEPAESAGSPADTEKAASAEAAQEDEAQGKPEAADGHARAAATSESSTQSDAPTAADDSAAPAGPAAPVRPAGHFTVPTAVAVVPSAPARRPAVEGGFDFFGTKKPSESASLEAVQNEDLADVVGEEALALHKAEAEGEFKRADEEPRAVGQVIDLTAHDETEQIDMQGLRSAVS